MDSFADELAVRLVELGFNGYVSCDECEVFLAHQVMPEVLSFPPVAEFDEKAIDRLPDRHSKPEIDSKLNSTLEVEIKNAMNQDHGKTYLNNQCTNNSYHEEVNTNQSQFHDNYHTDSSVTNHAAATASSEIQSPKIQPGKRTRHKGALIY
jgi:membrane-associated HD superfamily phosphohydrolase